MVTAHEHATSRRPRPLPWVQFAAAPLLPLAIAITLGIVLDRYSTWQPHTPFGLAFGGLLGWFAARRTSPTFALVCLYGGCAGLAAAHHRAYRAPHPTADVSRYTTAQSLYVQLRGYLDEPLRVRRTTPNEFDQHLGQSDRAVGVLQVQSIRSAEGTWHPVAGRVRVSIDRIATPDDREFVSSIRLGDALELGGRLRAPQGPSNPGEFDYRAFLADQGIHCELGLQHPRGSLQPLGEPGVWSVDRALAVWYGQLTRYLDSAFDPAEAVLARALLLGDTTAMNTDEWDRFARTGVIHVLAISGQHLMLLAGAVWGIGRIFGVRRRSVAWIVLGVVLGYALLTGLRPSAIRATVLIVAVCASLLLRRHASVANSFLLAWIIVAILKPTDLVTLGCQLSFFSVFVLIWGVRPYMTSDPLEDPIDALRREFAPRIAPWLTPLMQAYAVSVVILLLTTPLLVWRQNLFPAVGMLLGPPLIALTGVALVVGFFVLCVGPWSGGLLAPAEWVVGICLQFASVLVRLAERLPGAVWYVPAVPLWWVIGFYGITIAGLCLGPTVYRRGLVVLAAWVGLGLLVSRHNTDGELRVTFLAVGHGSCTVIELPDGRVFVYDVGSTSGPEMVRRVVAPYLWHRGIQQIDEVFISHADLDHYNGLGPLLTRFPIGQVTLTPSFATKPAREVADILLTLKTANTPLAIATAGEVRRAGDLTIEILHPSDKTRGQSENERSLVLRLTHRSHSIVLTGDLEKAGAQEVYRGPRIQADVLMAPHHGSKGAFSVETLDWANPKLIVASRGDRTRASAIEPTDTHGVRLWETPTQGAIVVRSSKNGLVAEASFSRDVLTIRSD